MIRSPLSRSRSVLVLASALLVAPAARAADRYWAMEASGLWSAPMNWLGGLVPSSVDDAYVGHDYPGFAFANPKALTVALDVDASVHALYSKAAFNLAGHSLALAAASQIDNDADLTGGTLTGAGALEVAGDATMAGTYLGYGPGALTVGGNLALSGANGFDRDVLVKGDTTFGPSGYYSFYATGSGTFTNAGTFTAATGSGGQFSWSASFVNEGTLTATGTGYGYFGGAAFTNSGTVDWSIVGGNGLGISGGQFTNTGLVAASNCTTVQIAATDNDNAGGTIRADGANTRVSLGGNWTTAGLGTLQATNGGEIALQGTVDNAGASLDLTGTGVTNYNATVVGGTVANSGAPLTRQSLVFDGAALDGGLDLDNSRITLRNGTTLGVPNVELRNGSTLTLADATATFDGTLTSHGYYNDLNGQTLTLGPGSRLSTAPGPNSVFQVSGLYGLTAKGAIEVGSGTQFNLYASYGALRNEGTITDSGALYASGPSFANAGTIALVGGSASLSTYPAGAFDNASGTITLDASSLRFGGDTTLASLENVSGANGSTIRYESGTAELGGGTLDLKGFGGDTAFALGGGTLAHGTLVNSEKIGDGYGGLTGVTLDADPTIRGGLTIKEGITTPNAKITLAGGSLSFGNVYSVDDQSFGGTISGSGELDFHGGGTFNQPVGGLIESKGYIYSYNYYGGSNADLAGTVRAVAGTTLSEGFNNLTTRTTALFQTDGAGSSLAISASTMSLGGVATATNGARMTLQAYGAFANTGTISADGAGTRLEFGGNTTPAKLGALTATNGARAFYTGGTMDLGGATFDLTTVGAVGAFGLYGGEIRNGTLLGTQKLEQEDGGYGTLRNVTLDADLNLKNFSLQANDGVTTPTNTLRLYNSSINLNAAYAPASIDATGDPNYYYGTSSSVYAQGGLTIGAGATATAHDHANLSLYGQVTNAGTILADGGYVGIGQSRDFVNTGLVEAKNGGSVYLGDYNGGGTNSGTIRADAGSSITLNMGAGWSNTGSVVADGEGARLFANGTTTHDVLAQTTLVNGGRLYLTGRVEAPGTTFDLASFGAAQSFGLNGGTLQVGTVASSDLLARDSRGNLQGATTLDKGLTLRTGYLQTDGDLDLGHGDLDLGRDGVNNYGSSLSVQGKTTFGGAARLDGSSFTTGSLAGLREATLDHRSSISVREGGFDLDEATLYEGSGIDGAAASSVGLVRAVRNPDYYYYGGSLSAPGLTVGGVVVEPGASLGLYTQNHGNVQVSGDVSNDGSLYGALDVNGGAVSGKGVFYDALNLHGATLSPGHSPGTIYAQAISFDGASDFKLEIGGDASSGIFDRLLGIYSDGRLALDGTLDLSLVGGYRPTTDQTWRFIDGYSGGISGAFATLNLGRGWSYGQDATGAFVRYAAPVPEPASFAAVALGLGVLMHRRKEGRRILP